MAGFVECLDNEEAEEGTEKGDGEREVPYLFLAVCEGVHEPEPSSVFSSKPAIFKPVKAQHAL